MLELLLNNSFLSAVIAFALVLIPAIIIHELGHFFAAKAIGISVLEFGVGFPPRAVRLFRWGETEFTLNWLPIGGFVRPLGEDMIAPFPNQRAEQSSDDAFAVDYDDVFNDDAHEESYDEKPKHYVDDYISEREILRERGVRDEDMLSVNEAKPWPRIFFMSAGALANFASAIVMFILVAITGIPQDVGGRMQIVYLPQASMFAGTSVEVGDAVELINNEYFEDTGDFLARLQALNGQQVTLTLRRIDDDEIYDVTVTPNISATRGYVFVAAVAPDSPAEAAGLQEGDLITAFNGMSISTDGEPTLELIDKTNEVAGQPVTLTILRGNRTFDVQLTPRLNPPPGHGRIGIAIDSQYVTSDQVRYATATNQQELIPLSFGEAVPYGFNRFGDTISLIVSIPAQIIEGTISPEEARPVSIVGISQVGGQFIQRSIEQGNPFLILNFVALISIFLGFTNLLPIPALDGGRILFVLIEIVRGKPVSPEVEGRIHWIGFALLLLLGLIIILYDIFNPLVIPT